MKENELDDIFPKLNEKQKAGLEKLFEANLDNPFESIDENKVLSKEEQFEKTLTDILHEADVVLRQEYKRMRNEFLTITPLVTEDAEYEIVEPIKIDNNKTEQNGNEAKTDL